MPVLTWHDANCDETTCALQYANPVLQFGSPFRCKLQNQPILQTGTAKIGLVSRPKNGTAFAHMCSDKKVERPEITRNGETNMSRMLKIEEDMDAITMAEMKATFDELAEAQEAVEIDMAAVEFIDSSGVGGLVFLYKRLLANSLKLTVTNVQGQPLRLLTHLRMQGLIASTSTASAA